MSDILYDVEIQKTNYEVIYGDDPVEEEDITVEVKKRWWCPCW
jgi:hypothetical protein